MAALALRHVTFITSGTVFVVDGPPLKAEKGVVLVDLAEPLNALGLWHRGYRINDETGEEIRTVGDLDALIESLTADPDVVPVSKVEPVDEDDEETAKVDAFVEALTADAEGDPEE